MRVCLFSLILLAGSVRFLNAASDADFFERRVRPVLVEHCYECHSPQAKQVEGGLLLDSKAGLLKGGEHGPALVPGHADESLLIEAIRRTGKLKMPPESELSPGEVEVLTLWVNEGAPWPRSAPAVKEGPPHWAFEPIRRPPVPEVAGWGDHPIDRFLFRRLKQEKLGPSKPAGRRALLRRAHIDLTGLPPSYEETRAFVEDPSGDAFVRVIDGLLKRREYGERWARHWLDLARYSDTKGYVDGGERRYAFAHTYRDYVIRSLNEDLPYDRFILEQVAADRLEPRDEGRSLAALGFLTVGNRFNFFPNEVLDDRIDVVTRGLMGLTVSCARCHDHKFDPITAADYYGLYGVFASSREPDPHRMPVIGLKLDEGEELAKELREKGEALEGKLGELHRKIQGEMRGWARDYLVYIVQLMPEHRTQAQPPLRTARGVVRDRSAYARGGVVRWQRYIVNCGKEDPVFGLWNRLVAMDRSEVAGAVERQVRELRDGPGINRLLEEAVALKPPDSMVALAGVYGDLLEETERQWLAAKKEDPALDAFPEAARESLRRVLYGPGAPAAVGLDESEDLYLLDESVAARKHFADVERVYLKSKGAAARAMSLVDLEEPVEPRVLVRGDATRPGGQVPRRFPRFLSAVSDGPFRDGSGRLDLARAIVDPKNPLTARVIVNRVWNWHFGSPLVPTLSDFGTRTAPPTHPELLDYLATWFREQGWSIKALHRLIMTSNAYQQQSRERAECSVVDPENRLFWRMNGRRLEFEAMRDSMLRVSGELVEGGGGRPVEKAYDDPANHVRSIYGLVDRELLPNLMRVFDFPSPDLSSAGRSQTTVPQQTLFLLNSPFVIARAEALVARLGEGVAGDDAIRRLYRWIYARDPSEEELALGRAFAGATTDPPAEVEEAPPAVWRHGYGEYDPGAGRLRSFTALPHFSGHAWQGGEGYPDGALHYLRLTATGGHGGIDRAHAVVRRWVSPVDGVVEVDGVLRHGAEDCGDGVEAWVVAGSELGHWTAYKAGVPIRLEGVEVKVGETIDFVVGCRENHSCDQFDWAPAILLKRGEGERRWAAAEAFGGTGPRRGLSRWVQYAQALLQGNEFLFVD